MPPLTAHVAAASLNQTVGDWAGNSRRIAAVIHAARERGARLVVLPELCISGYSLGDRLFMRGTLERSWRCLEELAPCTLGIVALIGLPVRHRDVLYNAVAVVADGEVRALVPKENLATGDVQYENRWFCGWPRGQVESFLAPSGEEIPFGSLFFEAEGLGRFGVEICEDGWKGNRPGSGAALAGALIIANPSASWFTLGKHRVRRDMVAQISREDHVAYLYTSLLGCDATRLVFDGSVFIAADGEILDEGRRFVFDAEWELVDRVLDLATLERTRMEEGSWRQQVESAQRGEFGGEPQLVVLPGRYPTRVPAAAGETWWTVGTRPSVDPDPSLRHLVDRHLIPPYQASDLPHLELELALCMGLREYRKKAGAPGFTLALSGGRDSAMCALLIQRQYRYDRPDLDSAGLAEHVRERFTTAYLGTSNSGDVTRDAARSVAEALGARHLEVGIQAAVDTHHALCEQLTGTRLSWDEPAHDIAMQNVQARLRGSLIWMVANLSGSLLVATSNLSEAAVGYTTMDGDTSGGLSPIADVPKSLVSLWLAWAARYHGLEALQAVAGLAPTAELRPPDRTQTDEADLMPYDILDRLVFQFVQRGQDPVQMFRTLWPELAPRYGGRAAAFAADVHKFVRLFCRAQWKRERFAISFRVVAFDLDPKSGFRFPAVQAPFTEELAELDLHVHHLTEGDEG